MATHVYVRDGGRWIHETAHTDREDAEGDAQELRDAGYKVKLARGADNYAAVRALTAKLNGETVV